MFYKLLLSVSLVCFIVGGLPIAGSADTECCCVPTYANLNYITETAPCEGDWWWECGECSANYIGSYCSFGCIIDDDCEGNGYLDCGETGEIFNFWVMQGSPDLSICDPLENGCECLLEHIFTEVLGTYYCTAANCATEGVECICPDSITSDP